MATNRYDHTISDRAKSHLQRLAERGGRRLPVDLEAEHLEQLSELVSQGYADNNAGVIRKAISEAHKQHINQPASKKKV